MINELDFDSLWDDIADVGRGPDGGYRRFAWSDADRTLREWFAAAAAQRGLAIEVDRNGNQWAWWGDPDAAGPGQGVVTGSHLDSVPSGGAFDGPLGVISALAAIDALRADDFTPARPIGVVNFVDEEGARFGVSCAGSRLLTGGLSAAQTHRLVDADGVSWADAAGQAGIDGRYLGRDDTTLARVGAFVELHIEQGHQLIELNEALGLGEGIWPQGRWQVDLPGEANHAGTTRLEDRRDAMLGFARVVLTARAAAERHGAVANCGKVIVTPNGTNAVAAHVTAWLDARGPAPDVVRAVVDQVTAAVLAEGGTVAEQSWTDATVFDDELRRRIDDALGGRPLLVTGAGHDAGILAGAGVPTAMIFVRNPTGVSHSPAEFAERADCLAGVEALAATLRELAW
jgi:N-carbamoyl-L-amino-acid hydrolase